MIRTAKICPSCGEGKDLLAGFHKDCTRPDGATIYCKRCRNKAQLLYVENNKDAQKERLSKWRKTENGRQSQLVRNKRYNKKYPERYRAERFIVYCISKGALLPARTKKCEHCGKQAQHYHHWNGYEPINYLEIIPLCMPCHRMAHKKSN